MTLIRRRGTSAALAAAAVATMALTACGNSDDGLDADGNIVLTVQVFGGAGFGYEDLIAQYEKDNPGIKVDYQIVTDDYDNEFRPNLIQQLDAGDGAGDVVGIEEQGVGQMMAMSEYWVDLAEYGLDSRKSDYTDWKWELGHTPEGKLAALGTDVGGMAMCYRTDLFEAAGLPTDREEVSALWPDWDGFTEVAEEFVASGVDAAFVDSPNQLYNIRMVQEAGAGDGISYFDREGEYALAESPAVRTAFDYVAELSEKGAVGQFQNWSDEWKQAMQAGGFATMGCPAWMLGVIADTSGDENAGNWDVATVPGGSGNWGGSWLGVPTQSKHPEEAAALASYLTSPEAQVAAFEAVSNFPSSPEAQAEPTVADMTNPYFNDAPSGRIFAESVAGFQPVFYGELHSAVRAAVEDVLFGMVEGSTDPDEAWDSFVAAGQEVVDTSM
ncbi:cellobiose-binding protein [Stackebrandtia albiflava]|uniref:Cellobiose-binding protein n=1 Tax=Stackebrandtia albiflava TaxID=406432 RepID=A0A562ULM3_9ACTN|nr:extracellular solute-binding protein [Stackebrandtia albiflava]TWJ06510.1 cellobiose-binding protein [Stackebrandtia albiflava]